MTEIQTHAPTTQRQPLILVCLIIICSLDHTRTDSLFMIRGSIFSLLHLNIRYALFQLTSVTSTFRKAGQRPLASHLHLQVRVECFLETTLAFLASCPALSSQCMMPATPRCNYPLDLLCVWRTQCEERSRSPQRPAAGLC